MEITIDQEDDGTFCIFLHTESSPGRAYGIGNQVKYWKTLGGVKKYISQRWPDAKIKINTVV